MQIFTNVPHQSLLSLIPRPCRLDLSEGKSRLELAQFSHKFTVELDFSSSVNMDSAALKSKISGIVYHAGATLTGKALKQSFNVFNSQGDKYQWDLFSPYSDTLSPTLPVQCPYLNP